MFAVARNDEPPHLLVPLDFGDASRAALARARELARSCRGRLTLLHVREERPLEATGLDAIRHLHDVLHRPSEPDSYLPRFGGPRTAVETAKQRPMEEARRRAVADSLEVAVAWRSGRPACEIVDYARQHAVDVIVLGVAPRRAARSTVLGPVADEVLRRAVCPVMTVRDLRAPEVTRAARVGARLAAGLATFNEQVRRTGRAAIVDPLAGWLRRARLAGSQASAAARRREAEGRPLEAALAARDDSTSEPPRARGGSNGEMAHRAPEGATAATTNDGTAPPHAATHRQAG